MKKRIKINGIVIFLATILLASFPAIFLRKEVTDSGDTLAEIVGIAMILLGQLVRVSARGYKSEHSYSGNVLIRGGPYSLVRNPMYLGILLIGLGVVFILFKWWVAFVFIAFFIIRYVLLIFQEEKKLKSLFQDSYLAYCKEVPHRIRPSLHALLKENIYDYIPMKIKWIKKEMVSIVSVLFLVILIESWEDIKREGIQSYFKELAAMSVVIILFVCLVWYLSSSTTNKDDPEKNQSS